MGPDETEDLGVQTERSVDLTCEQDEEMGPGPSTALAREPSTTLSLGPFTTLSLETSTTQDEPGPPRYPTGKAMEWESEPSDDEENTEQRFRRKEPTPAPTFNGRGPDAEIVAHDSHPQTTPTSSPSDILGDVAYDTQPPVEGNLTGSGEPMVEVAIRVGLGRGRQPTVRSDSSERGLPSPRKQFRPRWRALSTSGWVDVQHYGRPSLGRSLAGHLRTTPCSPRLTAALQEPDRGRFLPGHTEAERHRKRFFFPPK